ncbi:MAG TPA: apolipoprotein N-acyltransferase [Arenibaculum sp.]|nr:apolipoprotein N-acyltransferase [Arenibaculum sp.]
MSTAPHDAPLARSTGAGPGAASLPVRIAASVAALAGWRRAAAAFLLGALATLALPPAHAVPVLAVAFPGLLWLLDGARGRAGAFAVGWMFGFGHFLFGLYWISFALLTDIARYWWLMPFAAAGLPALLAVFVGLATLALHLLRLTGIARILAFAVLWTAAEWLRGHVFTGFPWNLIGYSWVAIEPVLQATAVIGVYGLGLLTVAVAALPTLTGEAPIPARRAWGAVLAGGGLLAAVAGLGAWRLAEAPAVETPAAMVDGVTLRLVQPGIEQSLKWAPGQREANFRRHLELAAAPGPAPVTHVVWPETAVPFLLEQDMGLRLAIAAATPPGGLTITGVPRAEGAPDDRRFWNSMLAVDGSGEIRAAYDKFHLVPFGEYMPLRRLIPFAAVAAAGGDFSAGPGPRTIDLPGLPPVSPLICYEVIFPGAVTSPEGRPAWLLNLTNDAWYGISAGPHQHFAIARVRAVEEGLPLVRAANTGISGVVDPYGRVVASLGLGEQGVVDSPLPAAIPPTLYSRYGNILLAVMLFIPMSFATLARHRP